MCVEAVIIRVLLSHVVKINIFPIFLLLFSSNYIFSSVEQLRLILNYQCTYWSILPYCFLSLHSFCIFFILNCNIFPSRYWISYYSTTGFVVTMNSFCENKHSYGWILLYWTLCTFHVLLSMLVSIFIHHLL